MQCNKLPVLQMVLTRCCVDMVAPLLSIIPLLGLEVTVHDLGQESHAGQGPERGSRKGDLLQQVQAVGGR